MVIALIGSHGTGKTTVFEALKQSKPEWLFFSEAVRHQSRVFGYHDPYQVTEKLGIGVFELMNINAWSVIDPLVNSALNPEKIIITDRSAVDNYGYYLAMRETEFDAKIETLLRGMAAHYASLVDIFVYFPIGKFPLQGDELRKGSVLHQSEIEHGIQGALCELNVVHNKLYYLKSTTVHERTEEITHLIP